MCIISSGRFEDFERNGRGEEGGRGGGREGGEGKLKECFWVERGMFWRGVFLALGTCISFSPLFFFHFVFIFVFIFVFNKTCEFLHKFQSFI